MKAINNFKNKSSLRTQIIKNKDALQSEQLSEQLWVSNRQSQQISRSNLLEKSSSRLDIEGLLAIFTEHYVAVEECFKTIGKELTRLEGRLAECFGRFNEVQWKLSREVHEVAQARTLNSSLLRINKEIEDKLAMVKNDYEELKRRRYISAMEQKIEELQETVHKMELQIYRSKFNKQELNSFEDSLDRLESILSKPAFTHETNVKVEILSEVMVDLIGFLRLQGDMSTWVQSKIHENISLKFQLMKSECSSQ